ncbi:MAG TPA: hypothetical protein VFB69_02485 [Candidatus Dormibacteraeota bacterium]|nr:hypothetical protein [Candidatus Dormibacteraeota bacterium]
MRVAKLASGVIVAAGIVYVLALLFNIPGGFAMPPTAATRLVASLSVFASAPALTVFAYAVRQAQPSNRTRVAFAIAAVFATVAVANRIAQLLVIGLSPDGAQQLDLYVTHSYAQGVEMLAWGILFGTVTALLTPSVRTWAGGWPARWLGASAVLSVVAGLAYSLALVATLPDWIGGIAVAFGGLAWGVTWPVSSALFLLSGRPRGSLRSQLS